MNAYAGFRRPAEWLPSATSRGLCAPSTVVCFDGDDEDEDDLWEWDDLELEADEPPDEADPWDDFPWDEDAEPSLEEDWDEVENEDD